MIDPKKILALFDEPTKNQGLILHYAYQAMPELAHRVIELEEQVDPYWMKRVKVLERALEIACKYTECPYADSMGSALPCDNNDLNCPQCFIAQAKGVRP